MNHLVVTEMSSLTIKAGLTPFALSNYHMPKTRSKPNGVHQKHTRGFFLLGSAWFLVHYPCSPYPVFRLRRFTTGHPASRAGQEALHLTRARIPEDAKIRFIRQMST